MPAMENAFKTVALIGKYMSPEIRGPMLELAGFMAERQIHVMVEEKTAEQLDIKGYTTVHIKDIGATADLAVVLGGDGTMLTVARALMHSSIPLVGVNRGRFGFLTDLSSESMLQSMGHILEGKFNIEQRMLLSATIFRDGKVLNEDFALNDVVVSKGPTARLIELEISIDGQFVHRQRSDGLIVATPTGTTAYALSAGGPILHPGLEAIALVPICPHTLSNRPIAINSASKVEITLTESGDSCVLFDGHQSTALVQGDKVLVQRAQKMVSLLHPLEHSHFAMLREKLHWG
jgi:NAD+ kinase